MIFQIRLRLVFQIIRLRLGIGLGLGCILSLNTAGLSLLCEGLVSLEALALNSDKFLIK